MNLFRCRTFECWDLALDDVSPTKANELQKRYRNLHFPINMICFLLTITSKFHQINSFRAKWIIQIIVSFNRFSEKYYNTLRNISLYNKKIDWSCELNRCGAANWRVLSLDHDDALPSGSLPLHFVIPRSISEIEYTKLSNSFRNGRAAIWVYSLGNVSLVRMAELMPTITDTRQENMILEIIRKCDPMTRTPHIMELSKCLPSNQDVQISYTKLRDLLTPDSTRQFVVQYIIPSLFCLHLIFQYSENSINYFSYFFQ